MERVQKKPPAARVTADDVEVSSESSDDDSLMLDGVVVRNGSAETSSSDSSEDESAAGTSLADKEGTGKEACDSRPADKRRSLKGPKVSNDPAVKDSNRKRKEPSSKTASPKTRKRKAKDEAEAVQVSFTFCDMDEKYFHGLKALLHESSTVYQSHSSVLADLMIENISVGTVVSTEGDPEANVFAFASVLNVSMYQESPAIQYLKQFCLKQCPADRRQELEVVLFGKTKRPAGFMLLGRMINVPLEIVEVLHQQLILDIDWAVEHAEGGEQERKSLDFGAFVRLAPCTREKGGVLVYRYFDDEVFAGRAEFVFTVDAPKSYSKEEKQLCNVIVMTKTGHRDAMKDLSKLVASG